MFHLEAGEACAQTQEADSTSWSAVRVRMTPTYHLRKNTETLLIGDGGVAKESHHISLTRRKTGEDRKGDRRTAWRFRWPALTNASCRPAGSTSNKPNQVLLLAAEFILHDHHHARTPPALLPPDCSASAIRKDLSYFARTGLGHNQRSTAFITLLLVGATCSVLAETTPQPGPHLPSIPNLRTLCASYHCQHCITETASSSPWRRLHNRHIWRTHSSRRRSWKLPPPNSTASPQIFRRPFVSARPVCCKPPEFSSDCHRSWSRSRSCSCIALGLARMVGV